MDREWSAQNLEVHHTEMFDTLPTSSFKHCLLSFFLMQERWNKDKVVHNCGWHVNQAS